MRIQLDTHALEALFPEGSDARVELQSAVIANFARKIKDSQINDTVVKLVRTELGADSTNLESMVKNVLRNEFNNVDNTWSKVTLRQDGRVKGAVADYASDRVKEMIEHLKRSGELKVDEHCIRLKSDLSTYINNTANSAMGQLKPTITKIVNESIGEIIRNELMVQLNSGKSLVNA